MRSFLLLNSFHHVVSWNLTLCLYSGQIPTITRGQWTQEIDGAPNATVDAYSRAELG